MDISRYFLVLGLLLAVFLAALCLILSTPALQWYGMDDVIWPAALLLLLLSTGTSAILFFPKGKRAIAASPYKKSFAVGLLLVGLYTATGIALLLFLPFRMASGI